MTTLSFPQMLRLLLQLLPLRLSSALVGARGKKNKKIKQHNNNQEVGGGARGGRVKNSVLV